MGDFNGDGHTDVVTANFDNTIGVLLGNGDGSFQPNIPTPVGVELFQVVAADFNEDGKLDVATGFLPRGAGAVNGLAVLLGNGDGTFQSPTGAPVEGRMAVGDFDRDGRPDLAVDDGELQILLGNGDGSFRLGSKAPAEYGVIGVADVDRNGTLDVVVGTFGILCPWFVDNTNCHDTPGSLAVFLGHGDGTFANPTVIDTNIFTRAVVLADVDLDGNLDVVATSFIGTHVLLGVGDGTFRGAGFGMMFSGALAVADLDGDGRPDLAESVSDCLACDAQIAFARGNGDGTFAAPIVYDINGVTNRIVVTHSRWRNEDGSPKSRKPRTVPLTPELRAALHAIRSTKLRARTCSRARMTAERSTPST
jgi:hypothetical protein